MHIFFSDNFCDGHNSLYILFLLHRYGNDIVIPTLIFLGNRQTFIAITDRDMFIKHIYICPRERSRQHTNLLKYKKIKHK